MERSRFLEECMVDPSLRDKLSILTRTFQNRRKVRRSGEDEGVHRGGR